MADAVQDLTARAALWSALRRSGSALTLCWIGAAMFAVVLGGGAAALGPLALKRIVDVAGEGPKTALAPMSAYAAALLLQRACELAQAYAYGRGEISLLRRFSALAYEHLLRLPITTHLDRRSGAMGQAVAEGVAGLRLILTHAVATCLPVAVQVLVGVAVLGSQIGAGLSLVLMGALSAYGVVFTLTVHRLGDPIRRMSGGNLEAGATLSDGLMNVEALKAFAAEGRQARRYDQALAAAERQWRRFLNTRLEGGALAALVFTATVCASFWMVIGEIGRKALTTGDLVLVNAYLFQIIRPIEQLGFAARDIGQGRAHLGALVALLREPTEARSASARPADETEGASLVFEAVDLALTPGHATLESVSFCVGSGETIALVGPSGAGKSSIVRLALGFYQPDRGRIRFDGRPLSDLGLTALRQQAALVSQDTILMNDTLAANIALGVEGAAYEAIATAAAAAGLSDLLGRAPDALLSRVGERGLKLSGGERQRVAIARALLKQARLLILDEATSALDPATERELWRTLEQATHGVTRLIVTHRLAAARSADRIVVLEAGRVVEAGPHGDLMRRRGTYWRLWRAQSRGKPQG